MGPLGAALGLLGRGATAVAPYVPSIVKQAGQKAKNNPWKTGIGTGAGGLLAYEMMAPNSQEEEVRTGGQGLNPAMPQVRGRTPIADNWSPSSSLENNLEYSLKMEARNAKVLKKVLMH